MSHTDSAGLLQWKVSACNSVLVDVRKQLLRCWCKDLLGFFSQKQLAPQQSVLRWEPKGCHDGSRQERVPRGEGSSQSYRERGKGGPSCPQGGGYSGRLWPKELRALLQAERPAHKVGSFQLDKLSGCSAEAILDRKICSAPVVY